MGHTPGAKRAVVAFEESDLDASVQKLEEQALSFIAVQVGTVPVSQP
jgi:hypothetical protein